MTAQNSLTDSNDETVMTPADLGSTEHDTGTCLFTVSFDGCLSVRVGESRFSRVVWYLKEGDAVEVLESNDGVSKIQFGKRQVGYVLSRFLRRL